MDSLINSLEQTRISNKFGQCTEKFLKDITEILDNIIRYFYISGVIYSEISIILDILSHNGNELICDNTETFNQDCIWFKIHGKTYTIQYLTSKIQLTTHQQFDDISSLYDNMITLFDGMGSFESY